MPLSAIGIVWHTGQVARAFQKRSARESRSTFCTILKASTPFRGEGVQAQVDGASGATWASGSLASEALASTLETPEEIEVRDFPLL